MYVNAFFIQEDILVVKADEGTFVAFDNSAVNKPFNRNF